MKENVVIIGGGIAGMEAAGQLLSLGYNPIIVEQQDHLGGHVAQWHRLFPDMIPAQELVQKLGESIAEANVFLETRVNFVNRLSDGWNVMLSNGINIVCRAILVASGFTLFDASRKEEYGYGVYDHVITNADLEAWLNGSADRRVPFRPESMGFVHCVGSRDMKAGNTQCSKVCCTTAIKQAIEMKERFPDSNVYCFYMDLRLFGKKYEDFYINAQKQWGVQFIRGRVSEVSETMEGRLQVKAEDTLSGRPVKVQLDLLVLMSGMVCNEHSSRMAGMMGLDIDSDGFIRSRDNEYHIVESNRPGVFYAGTCTGTKTVPETVCEARSAALAIHNYLKGR
ncbi:MAG: FAD-dependent oxidoreductase [Bacteroidaceae bacterium]|nr:FAD-dependent oxidoreductase [Bacteroidaceae bacterium]